MTRLPGNGWGAEGTGLVAGSLPGVSTTAQLRATGLSEAGIRRLVRAGLLRQVVRGVYGRADLVAAVGGGPSGEHLLRLAAAVALTGSRSVGSHHSAAIVHGLGLLGQPPARVAVTRSPDDLGSRTSGAGVLVHVAALPAGQVIMRRGVLVTTPARTVIDLARAQSFASGVVAADSALHARMTTKAELAAVLAQCPRWPGIERARKVVEFSDARAESALESLARAVFHEYGLPPPDLQVWIGDDDLVIGRVDFLWRRYRTIAEADGRVKYANPSRALAQLDRDARLRAAGYEVVHFTWPEITRVPDQVVSSVRLAFRRGGTT